VRTQLRRHQSVETRRRPHRRWLVLPLLAALSATLVPAEASATPGWDALAHCESSGNWAADTGNGYYGGLQFSASTWAGYGGREFAAQANLASKDQQITVATRVAAAQGWGAWPVCSKKAGLAGTSTPRTATVKVNVQAPAPKATPPTKTTAPAAPAPSGDVWTALAQCSSSGNWAIHPGNGYSGGLAIKTSTWTLFGGRQYAANPQQASRADQITVAQRIVAGQGWKAWPACATRLGLSGTALAPASPAPQATPPAKLGKPVPSAHRDTTPAPRATATLTSANTTSSTGVAVTLPDGSTVTAPNTAAATAVKAALGQLGVPYAYGAARPGRLLDCSALIQYAYRQAGISLSRTSGSMATGARIASAAQLLAGDLLVWNGHVAMYLGRNKIIETGSTVVKIHPFRTTNAGMRFLGYYRPTG
jgi:cell wall-associated NlpC family hydrolase